MRGIGGSRRLSGYMEAYGAIVDCGKLLGYWGIGGYRGGYRGI